LYPIPLSLSIPPRNALATLGSSSPRLLPPSLPCPIFRSDLARPETPAASVASSRPWPSVAFAEDDMPFEIADDDPWSFDGAARVLARLAVLLHFC
jgi:hypothetical protein